MQHRYLVTSKAQPGRCGACSSWVLSGLAEGLWAHVDPLLLSPELEAVALLTGRWCYTLTYGALIRRDGAIRQGPVLAEHRCGQPIGKPAVYLPKPRESEYPPY